MDLKQHLLRQMAFSFATFGPGVRTEGLIDHIQKELEEVRESNGSADEWVDIVILALDGLTRQLAFCNDPAKYPRVDPKLVATNACNMLEGKQSRNEGRNWPDWRTTEPGKAIEHIRN